MLSQKIEDSTLTEYRIGMIELSKAKPNHEVISSLK